MPKRDYKIFGENEHFHIYNRGNNLQDIFLDDEDYEFFILRLKQNIFPDKEVKRIKPLPENSFSLLSYCLMPNHFHLLLRQNKEYTPQQLLLRISTSYSKYFNKKYKRTGHVFQDRFKQSHVDDDEYLLWMHAYINLNPVINKAVKDAGNYRWSSYSEFKNRNTGLCDKTFINEKLKNSSDLEEFMKNALPVLKLNRQLRYSGIE